MRQYRRSSTVVNGDVSTRSHIGLSTGPGATIEPWSRRGGLERGEGDEVSVIPFEHAGQGLASRLDRSGEVDPDLIGDLGRRVHVVRPDDAEADMLMRMSIGTPGDGGRWRISPSTSAGRERSAGKHGVDAAQTAVARHGGGRLRLRSPCAAATQAGALEAILGRSLARGGVPPLRRRLLVVVAGWGGGGGSGW
jgi:hypothetical protein